MAYYKKILKDTIDAINKCYEKSHLDVNVKRVRKCNAIPSSDRSKIIFISKALEDLKQLGYLEFVGNNSPKTYKIIEKIDNFDHVLKQIENGVIDRKLD